MKDKGIEDQDTSFEVSVEEQVNQALDASVENLSLQLRRKLNKIRIESIEPRRKLIPLWKTATAFSFIVALVVGWQFWQTQPEMPLTPFAEVLEEDLDMLDDLEFVYWMAEETEIATL